MKERKTRGTALIVATTVAFIVVVIAVSLIALSVSGAKLNQSQLESTTARYTARGALSAAIIALNKNKEVVEIQGNGVYWDSIIVKLKDESWKQLSNELGEIVSPRAMKVFEDRLVRLKKRPGMDFKVYIRPHGEKNFVAKVHTCLGQSGYAWEGYILSSGSPYFSTAAFGEKIVEIKGNCGIDSYHSANGEYGQDNYGSQGHIGCNEAITIVGNAKIYGNARPGPGHTISSPERVEGDTTPSEKKIFLPPVEEEWQKEPPQPFPSSGDIHLTTGSYYYEEIQLSSKRKLVIDGDVSLHSLGNAIFTGLSELEIKPDASLTFYVGGVLHFSGQFNTYPLKPSAFQIRSTYSNLKMEGELPDVEEPDSWGVILSGNSKISGVVYAPKTYVLLTGQSDFFGSLVGYGVKVTGSSSLEAHPGNRLTKLHYDESLQEMRDPNTMFYSLAEIFKSSFEEN